MKIDLKNTNISAGVPIEINGAFAPAFRSAISGDKIDIINIRVDGAYYPDAKAVFIPGPFAYMATVTIGDSVLTFEITPTDYVTVDVSDPVEPTVYGPLTITANGEFDPSNYGLTAFDHVTAEIPPIVPWRDPQYILTRQMSIRTTGEIFNYTSEMCFVIDRGENPVTDTVLIIYNTNLSSTNNASTRIAEGDDPPAPGVMYTIRNLAVDTLSGATRKIGGMLCIKTTARYVGVCFPDQTDMRNATATIKWMDNNPFGW